MDNRNDLTWLEWGSMVIFNVSGFGVCLMTYLWKACWLKTPFNSTNHMLEARFPFQQSDAHMIDSHKRITNLLKIHTSSLGSWTLPCSPPYLKTLVGKEISFLTNGICGPSLASHAECQRQRRREFEGILHGMEGRLNSCLHRLRLHIWSLIPMFFSSEKGSPSPKKQKCKWKRRQCLNKMSQASSPELRSGLNTWKLT